MFKEAHNISKIKIRALLPLYRPGNICPVMKKDLLEKAA
jgi:hypothetical protein